MFKKIGITILVILAIVVYILLLLPAGFGFLGTTLPMDFIGVAAAFGIVLLAYYDDPKKGALVAALAGVAAFIVAFPLNQYIMYYYQPSFQGSYFGYFELLFCSFLPGLGVGVAVLHLADDAQERNRIIATGCAILLALVFFAIPICQHWNATFGFSPAQTYSQYAKQANIREAKPEETIPPTDPDHMVVITQAIAAWKGQTALSNKGLGSRYQVVEGQYVLQSIKGHRYWAAPLTLAMTSDEWNMGDVYSPGYVLVDAEVDKDAELRLGYRITLFPDQSWGLSLQRFVYQRGFNTGWLDDSTFEVDDEGNPTFTMAYLKHPFGTNGMAGSELHQVILVRFESSGQPILEAFVPGEQPKWIDRVMSGELVDEYVYNWGYFASENAQKNFWSVSVWGTNKEGTLAQAERELMYTKSDHNVWVIPMQSTNGSDKGVYGVLVYETNKNEAVYYPGLRGFNTGQTVMETMHKAPANIKNYDVASVQLYSIYGELTWVGIFTAPQSIGASFAGIGFMRANTQEAASVVFANDKQTALGLYASQLAHKKGENGTISQTSTPSKTITARIKRIGAVISPTNPMPTYQFTVYGDRHEFIVTKQTYSRIALVRDGDTVTFTYMDTKNSEEAVGSFTCPVVDDNGPERK